MRTGAGLSSPGEYLLPRSSPTPFHCPHRPEVLAPPGTGTALGTLALAGAAEPGTATVRTNDSAPFVPRERFGQNGGGCVWGGGGMRSVAVLSCHLSVQASEVPPGRVGSGQVNKEAPCWLVP